MPYIDRSAASKEDILSIAAYIAADNFDAATKWILILDQKLTLLAENPGLGHSKSRFGRGLRSFP